MTIEEIVKGVAWLAEKMFYENLMDKIEAGEDVSKEALIALMKYLRTRIED